MRDECLTLLGNGVSDTSIQAWLTPLSGQTVVKDGETGFGDTYTATQVRLAKQWLTYLKSGRRSDLAAKLGVEPPQSMFPLVASLKGGLQ